MNTLSKFKCLQHFYKSSAILEYSCTYSFVPEYCYQYVFYHVSNGVVHVSVYHYTCTSMLMYCVSIAAGRRFRKSHLRAILPVLILQMQQILCRPEPKATVTGKILQYSEPGKSGLSQAQQPAGEEPATKFSTQYY